MAPSSEPGGFPIDPDNPVVALCAAGMAVEGSPDEAIALFEQAWAARTDDYDVCCDFLAHVRGGANASLREQALLRQALDGSRVARAQRADELGAMLPGLGLGDEGAA